ncbi:hypothetical protein Tco_0933224 [Tanacetum coccineum]
MSPVLEEEPAKKPKRDKKPAKKSTTMPTAGVVIRDTPTLLEAAQLKKALKKSNQYTHMLHASGSSKGAYFELEVPDEIKGKITGTDEGTGTIPGVPNVPKYQSESENESWGDSEDNDDNDDDSDNDVDNDVDSDGDDEEEEEYKEEYVHTPKKYEPFDDDDEHVDEEEYEDKTKYKQFKEDEHVTLTTVHDSQKTEVPLQSSPISSDFATQFLNLDNPSLADTEINSIMNIDVRYEEPSSQTPSFLTIPKAFRSYTAEFENEAKDERRRYIDLIEKSVKDIISNEVKTQLPQILPKAVSDFATPMIKSTITESLEDVVLAKSSSQPQSTYEATA